MHIPDSDLALATAVALRDDEPHSKLVMLCQLVAGLTSHTWPVEATREEKTAEQLGLGI